MTASVGDLLDAVHARAWDLAGRAEPSAAEARLERAVSLLAAWPRLGAAVLRALDAVPLDSAAQGSLVAVRDCLAEVAGQTRWGAAGSSGPAVVPDREVVAIAARVGAIADLLVGQPRAVSEGDQQAAFGLQASLLAPVFAVATTTLAALDDVPGMVEERWRLRGIAVRTEPFALIEAGSRSGRYEDVAAPTPGDRSLDAAIAAWLPATTRVLAGRRQLAGTAVQVAAGDVLIVTAAAATVSAAALHHGVLDQARGEGAWAALHAAHEAWRDPARWPTTIRLEGPRSAEQIDASRTLRQVLTHSLRYDGTWLPADELVQRWDLGALLATMRRSVHAAGNVAVAHFQAVENLVHGRDQLWIAAKAVTDPALQSPAVIEAACRRRWVPMPRGDATGLQLLQAAAQALTTTTAAVGAFDQTAAAAPAPPPRSELALDRGRIVARLLPASPVVETVRTVEPSGARAERLTLPGFAERPVLGPRR